MEELFKLKKKSLFTLSHPFFNQICSYSMALFLIFTLLDRFIQMFIVTFLFNFLFYRKFLHSIDTSIAKRFYLTRVGLQPLLRFWGNAVLSLKIFGFLRNSDFSNFLNIWCLFRNLPLFWLAHHFNRI
jgi:hypothetical protein